MNSRVKVILISLGIFASLYFYRCYREYYKEYDLIKSELKKIEGIKIVSIDGYSEDFALENIYVTIELNDGSILKFSDLHQKHFEDADVIYVDQFNNWGFQKINYLKDVVSRGFNAGKHSEYPAIRKLNIKNISELIHHSGEIKKVINSISEYPAADTLETENGKIYIQKYDSNQTPSF